MGVQLIFVVETNKKCKSDWIYIKDTIDHFFEYDHAHVRLSTVYMDGKSDKDRECKATEYAIKNGACSSDNNVTCWWLRSLGVDCDIAAFVDRDGYVFVDGIDVDAYFYAVRPAMWISMK